MKKRVRIFIFIVLTGTVLFGCDLSSSTYMKYEVYPDIIGWNLPDTSKVNTVFNLRLITSINNSCTKNPRFHVVKSKDFEYNVVASATYENHGEDCLDAETTVDSTRSMFLTTVGKYYFYFKNDKAVGKDSIYIVP
jgi:hypothetical protein